MAKKRIYKGQVLPTGVTKKERNGTVYFYAALGGKNPQICGKGDQGLQDALEAREKYSYQKRQAKREGIGLETRTTHFKSFLDMMNWFMDLAAKQKKASTYKRYLNSAGHLAKHFGSYPVSGIEAVDLEQYRAQRNAEGATDSSVDMDLRLVYCCQVFSAVMVNVT